MKKALCLLTLAAALSVGSIGAAAASPLPADSPVCPAPEAAALTTAAGLAGVAFAADATAPKAKCPRPGILCPDVYDPVVCSNGKTYPNACYAYVDCATGCVAS